MPVCEALRRLRGQGIGAVLARGASGAFAVHVLGIGVAYGTQIALARLLGGPQAYGDYSYPLIWMSVLLLAGKIGFDTAAVRFVASYNADADWGRMRGFVARSFQLVLALSLVTALLATGFVWAWWAGGHLRPELLAVCLLAWLVLPFQALLELSASCLRGLKNIVAALAPKQLLRPLLLVGGASLLALQLDGPLRPAQAMFANVVAFAVTFGVSAFLLLRRAPQQMLTAESRYETRFWIGVAMPLWLLSGLHLVLAQTDMLMIGALRGNADVGVYRVAANTAHLARFGLTAVNLIAAPMISELYFQGRMADLQRMATLAARGICAFAVPVTIVMVLFGRPILGLFGAGFEEGYPVLVLLLLAQLVNALGGSVGFLLSMTGHQREAAVIVGASAAVNLLLNAILIPWYGMLGAAVATAVSLVVWKATMFVYVYRKLRINPTMLPLRGYHE